MEDFEAEIRERLRAEFGINETDASRIAEQAARFNEDADGVFDVSDLIDRMHRRPHDDPNERWNAVVGYLYLTVMATDDEEGTKNPYQV